MIVREEKKEYLEKIKIETLKKALIEQCEDTAKLNLEICDDFKYVDGEQEWHKGMMGLPRRYAPHNDRKGMTKEGVRRVLYFFYNFTTSYNKSYV